MLELSDVDMGEVVDGESTDQLLKRLLLRLLDGTAKTSPLIGRMDRLEVAILEGMKRSRSRTFGSNG